MAYMLTSSKGGTVRFIPNDTGVVEKESESYSSSVTSNPVEDGADINDHVNNAQGQLSISGTIVGGDSAINRLKQMRASRAILTMTSQDAGKSSNAQLAKTTNAGMTVVAYQSVSSASASRRDAAYSGGSSSAPLTRQTGGYNGVR